MIEGLCITVLVGLAVDYCVHIALAFSEAEAVGVTDRLRHALVLMGTTVLGAGCTTAVSSGMLLFCTLLLFQKTGTVMVLNAVVGMVAAIALFPPLMKHAHAAC